PVLDRQRWHATLYSIPTPRQPPRALDERAPPNNRGPSGRPRPGAGLLRTEDAQGQLSCCAIAEDRLRDVRVLGLGADRRLSVRLRRLDDDCRRAWPASDPADGWARKGRDRSTVRLKYEGEQQPNR